MASDYFVSSFNAEHNGCTGFAKATGNQITSMSQARAATLNNPNVSGKALVEQVHRVEDVEVSRRMAIEP
ncbi:hypothetical protein JG688_00018240 [Phytophthora aleatoria]|uniref:Uncharacterized protein n=1 Tax=Phytophthora aleatoria TaxID=2496075 RepID=A0A8J5M0S3_9STRA|nr:hypothetical protein JG688_00018240 [Phytophthora aleatoria]